MTRHDRNIGRVSDNQMLLLPARLLRRKQAATYVEKTWGIPLSNQTLAKLAVIGGGPEYRKWGRFPLYDVVDLDRWVETRLGPKQFTTSDLCATRLGVEQ
jgi:hypothetical protein